MARVLKSPRARARSLQAKLREFYEGETVNGHRFRYGLLIFDVLTLIFIAGTSFLTRTPLIEAIDVFFGLVILGDVAARLIVCPNPFRELVRPTTLADVVAIVSFLAPLVGEGGAFLRVLRTLRLLHTYQILARLRADSPFFKRNEDVIVASANLLVFMFVMTGIVYETQHWTNPQIANYVDALYFTVTSLTTTGFGDITLPGTLGRLISVAIMIFGVTLFLNLARTLFQPRKGALPMPDMRPAAPRAGCRSLQGVRNGARDSR